MAKIDFKNIEFKKLIGPTIVAALFILLYFPTLDWMTNSWIHSDYYSHGFILVPVMVLIIYTRRHDLQKQNPYPKGVWLLVAGLGVYIIGFLRLDSFLSALSLFLTLPGLVLFPTSNKRAQNQRFTAIKKRKPQCSA